MGTFGTTIFSDDFACDIRDEFKELIGDGLTPQQATYELLESYSSSLTDPDEVAIFWLSLAASQWKLGRLLENVKEKAIAIIDNETDLNRWRLEGDRKLVEKRKRELDKLKEQLLSTQPFAKKIARVYKEFTPFEVGDVFSYKHSSGNYALLRVVGHAVDKGGRRPHCELLDFFNKEIPTNTDVLETISFVVFAEKTKMLPLRISLMQIGDCSKRYEPKDKVQLVAKNIKGQQKDKGPWQSFLWRDFDERLTELFLNRKSSS